MGLPWTAYRVLLSVMGGRQNASNREMPSLSPRVVLSRGVWLEQEMFFLKATESKGRNRQIVEDCVPWAKELGPDVPSLRELLRIHISSRSDMIKKAHLKVLLNSQRDPQLLLS